MIEPWRFVASKNVSAERWLSARREGVTATQVATTTPVSRVKVTVKMMLWICMNIENL